MAVTIYREGKGRWRWKRTLGQPDGPVVMLERSPAYASRERAVEEARRLNPEAVLVIDEPIGEGRL